ncbi:RNA-binding domain-containing protein [Lentinula edodes]|uniref:Probable RNA-binding protein 18 n=1 Tax=Lentinula edodes TaxID=5353 RepID=A0A1Q3EL36_LENED|nr:RNA-binding domain-containing protein [Lentinula edodes]
MAELDENNVSVTSPELINDTVAMTELLSFPANTPSSSAKSACDPPSTSARQLLRDRLFIGNLHPTVDEYTLLQIFTKFGKVTKLDFLFHKSGVLKGKPRGYAFLEYGSHNEAQKALNSANGKLLRGRKLAVTYANQAPSDADGGVSRQRKTMMETGRPTTLSMLKSNTGGKHKDGTTNKIAMMEAKLRELEASKPKHNTEPGTSTLPTSSLPTHPSLPPKPPLTVPNVGVPQSQNPTVSKQSLTASFAPLLRSSSTSNHHSPTGSEPLTKKIKLASTSGPPEVAKRKSSGKGLLGVKIVKKWTSPSPMPPSSSDDHIVDHHHNQEPPWHQVHSIFLFKYSMELVI